MIKEKIKDKLYFTIRDDDFNIIDKNYDNEKLKIHLHFDIKML